MVGRIITAVAGLAVTVFSIASRLRAVGMALVQALGVLAMAAMVKLELEQPAFASKAKMVLLRIR